MNVTRLVVNPLPHQGSVLGRVVAESRLGQICIAVHRWLVLSRAVAETHAELAALRATTSNKNNNCKHGMLEICCAICKEQKSGVVDARGTANRYTIRQEITKDTVGYIPILLTPEWEITLREIFNNKQTHPITPAELHQMRVDEQEERERRRLLGLPSGSLYFDAKARAKYEQKLFADVAAYHAREKERREEAPRLKKAAELEWKYRVAFEFPKVCDEMQIKEAKRTHGTKRHYVRHGEADLHFVRKQDIELATDSL